MLHFKKIYSYQKIHLEAFRLRHSDDSPIDFEAQIEVEEPDYSSLNNLDKFFIVNLEGDKWTLKLSADMLSTDWNKDDPISISDAELFTSNYDETEGILTLELSLNDVSIGSTMIPSVLNENTGEYEEIFINFSDDEKLKFYSDEQASLYGVYDTDAYDLVEQPTSTRATTSSTKYNVYDASGTPKQSGLGNPFVAIQYVVTKGSAGWTVKQSNDSAIVFTFTPGNPSTFYKFQFTQFYGNTTIATEAKSWATGYGGSHVVRSDGIFGANKNATDNQPNGHFYKYYKNPPADYMLEGNTGGYVYNHALSYNGYKSMKATVLLSQAQLYKTGNSSLGTRINLNPYVYMNSTNNYNGKSYGVDLGLIYITDGSATTGWYLCRNPFGEGLWVDKGTLISKQQDVELTFKYETGKVTLTAYNLTTASSKSVSHSSVGYDTSAQNIGLMAATTLVPDAGKTTNNYRMAFDIKSGSYFKNVTWQNLRCFVSSNATGTAYNITPTGAYTNTIITYDTDSTNYSYSGNNHTVDIYYNPTYK